MRTNAFDVVSLFEKALAEYTGAPYAVCIDSCTDAIFLSCIYKDVKGKKITIPKRTYLSVPQSIMQAGAVLQFEDLEWTGAYQLKGTNIYDSAKRFTKDMYIPGTMMCLSFHLKKILNIGKGGAVLTDDKEAVEWLKRARYEGRTPGLDYRKDDITHLINKKNYWGFAKQTIRDYIVKVSDESAWEYPNSFEEIPSKHPNEKGYNLISEEIYNYIVKNNII